MVSSSSPVDFKLTTEYRQTEENEGHEQIAISVLTFIYDCFFPMLVQPLLFLSNHLFQLTFE
jgi:hypothetical protein